ncbi:glycosyltransferase family 4 protein [Bradyrhizobium sp. WSM 1738]|nr:glycosyltransferase family 4 protein [Bradyrhizobium hereditatis]
MNILLLTSEFAPAMGGIGTYAREIAAAASRLGAEVTVMAPDYAQQTDESDRALPFEVVRFSGGLHSMRDLPRKIMLARRGVRARRYDVVHAADWPFFIPVALSRWQTQARVLMTVHGTEINETQTALKRMAIRGAGVFGPRTEVIANSRFTETLFRERFAANPGRISAINLGVSGFWFSGQRKRREVRLAYRLAEDRVVMITVARITRRKGHHLTLAALSKLPDDLRKQITWLVIGPDGEADYVSELKRSAAQLACDIRFLGAQTNEEIRDIYAASDFFCLTGLPDTSGRVEGFGLVYLEAGAAGLPSVATEVGGVPDAVLADETGILVSPSVESISQAIAELASDRGLRAILAAGASVHAGALSWERCAATTYGLPYAGKRAAADRAVGLTA